MPNVIFSIELGRRDHQEYDRTKLFLGATVHVTSSPTGDQYTAEATAASLPYYVTWIAPSEWYVTLSPGVKVRDTDSQTLKRALHGHLDGLTIDQALAYCSSIIEPSEQHLTASREKNPIDQLITVADRLILVDSLSAKDVAHSLYDQYEPLVIHLLMTCFDRLGQPAEWISFPSWLDQKTTKALSVDAAPATMQATELYRIWSSKYGVRNSFYRFLDEVLPQETLHSLLASIEIRKMSNPPEIVEMVITDKDKKAWLYETRNRYSHNAQQTKGFHPELFGPVSVAKQGRGYRFEKRAWVNYHVEGWPGIVIDAVRTGLIGRVKALAAFKSDLTDSDIPRTF